MAYEEHPFWKPKYAESITTLKEKIPLYFEKVKTFIENPENENFVNGFVDMYRSRYITECNNGERTGTQTIEETEEALRENPKSLSTERHKMKTQNLSNAINHIFGNSLIVKELKHEFTPRLAQELNELIGKGLFQAGSYRTTDAKPTGYNYIYLPSTQIEEEMMKLFTGTRKKLLDVNSLWYQVASEFFERFLYIHPFVNGNGRTARLLMSALLLKYNLLPVSLFHLTSDEKRKKTNEVYLKCIDEAHSHKNFHLLNSLIIESSYRSLYTCIKYLDLGT